MSSKEIEAARRVSPTLRRRRSSSTRQAVLTREHLAGAAGDKMPKEPGHLAKAEPFVDEFLTVESEPGTGRGRWLGLILACATIGLGAFIIATSLSQ